MKAKFGLSLTEVIEVLEYLKARGMEDCLQLVHCHPGSQLQDIRRVNANPYEEASAVFGPREPTIDGLSRDMDWRTEALTTAVERADRVLFVVDASDAAAVASVAAEDQVKAISVIGEKAGFNALVLNFLKVVASNRRLFAVPGMVAAYRQIAARHKGEITADVTSAHALTAEQETELKAALKGVTGKEVSISVTVDPSLLGGLIVKVGSRQIDTSLRTKLSTLKLALKEVG